MYICISLSLLSSLLSSLSLSLLLLCYTSLLITRFYCICILGQFQTSFYTTLKKSIYTRICNIKKSIYTRICNIKKVNLHPHMQHQKIQFTPVYTTFKKSIYTRFATLKKSIYTRICNILRT